MSKEKRVTLIIILVILCILFIIIIPLIIKYNKEQNKINFPEYNDIEITEGLLDNEITYEQIKKEFENDYYFNKLAIMMDYDSSQYTSAYLKNMLWNLIFNYEISNDNYFSYFDSKEGKYCFSKHNLINAFKELYDVDISENYNYLEGYYQYVYLSGKGYCLDFKKVAQEYNKNIKVAVERMAMIGTTITTDLYVYEYSAITENEKYYENLLAQAIDKKNYSQAKSITENNLNGEVTHKQLQFKKNTNGKFFKYKILISKKLLY